MYIQIFKHQDLVLHVLHVYCLPYYDLCIQTKPQNVNILLSTKNHS